MVNLTVKPQKEIFILMQAKNFMLVVLEWSPKNQVTNKTFSLEEEVEST
jgi:hypothetical protein